MFLSLMVSMALTTPLDPHLHKGQGEHSQARGVSQLYSYLEPKKEEATSKWVEGRRACLVEGLAVQQDLGECVAKC